MSHPMPDPNPYPFVPIEGGTIEQEACNVSAYGNFLSAWLACPPSNAQCVYNAYHGENGYLADRSACAAS